MQRRFTIVKTLIFSIFLFYGTITQSQLVNIESKRMHTDSLRFVLNSDLLFNYTDNNGLYILQILANTSIQFKSKNLKNLFFLVGNVNLIRSEDEDFQNSWFAHGRYNRKLSEFLRAEAFIQSQNNQKLTIRQRDLVGAGLRLKLIAKANTLAYFGNSYMYEVEAIDTLDEKFYNHRNSSYLSINQSFTKINLSLTGTLYFQPLYKTIANHRILSQLKMVIPLARKLSLTGLYNYSVIRFDSDLDDDSASNVSFGFTLGL